MRTGAAAMIAFLCIISARGVESQQPAPKVDSTPLARPVPLAVLKPQDPAALLDQITTTIKAAGFTISRIDTSDQLIDAKRAELPPSKNYDRVIVWLERDFRDPLKTVKIFLLYGRYEEIVSATRSVERIVISSDREEQRVGALKQSLLSGGN